MTLRNPVRIWRVTSVCLLTWFGQHAIAALQGIDADREETRIEREFSRAPVADAYLQLIVDRIVSASPTPITIRAKALVDRHPFVFCMGNGALYVSTGLLARLENDSQVAALLAPEITGAMAPNRELEARIDAGNSKLHHGMNLLAIVATGGIAAFPIMSADSKAMNSRVGALILDNDIRAVAWLRRAGFDPTQGPAATRRLRDLLGAEKQFGTSRLASDAGLEARGRQLQQALATAPAMEPANLATESSGELLRLARLFSLVIARQYMENSSLRGSLPPTLDRLEREQGVDGITACLRAEYLRGQPTSAEVPAAVIEAFRGCVAHPDAPSINFRELGFLQRDAGNTVAAIESFEHYLQRAPAAVDTPIIKSYVEELRAKLQ